MIVILIIISALFVLYKLWNLFKIPKIGCMAMTTGAVKSGKSTFSVYLAVKKIKSQIRKYKFRKFFCKLFKKPLPEKPMLYSNVPLANVEYVLITNDLLRRQVRPAYGSVIYIQEASLVADSMNYKDSLLNEQLLLFNKLIGHETRGGYIIYDTQCIADVHYSIKRCISDYFYIHHSVKIPFFCFLFLRECRYSDDDSSINTFDSDIEEDLKLVIVPKSVWKKFDCYCFSALTDALPVLDGGKCIENRLLHKANLKIFDIISFNKFKTIKTKEVKKIDGINEKKVE